MRPEIRRLKAEGYLAGNGKKEVAFACLDFPKDEVVERIPGQLLAGDEGCQSLLRRGFSVYETGWLVNE